MYIGRDVDNISNVEKLDNITFDGGTTYALTKSSVAYTPSSSNCILLSIDGIVQQGNFSVSTTNIVFDWSPTSSNTCDWILHFGTGLITTPADSSVTASKLGSLAVTGAKLNTDVISAQTELAVAPADADEFMVSDGGVLKRIDYSLIKAANTPAFMATLSAAQDVSDNTNTKVSADTELFDTDSDYDNSSNYRFTPQVAGKYFVFGSVFCDPQTVSDLVYGRVLLYKNGAQVKYVTIDFRAAAGREVMASTSLIVDMNGSSDYVELFGNVNASDGAGMRFGATETFWGAYKLIT
jgi:hypothetical protein